MVNDDYKTSEDWWMDPLAMFEDEEDEPEEESMMMMDEDEDTAWTAPEEEEAAAPADPWGADAFSLPEDDYSLPEEDYSPPPPIPRVDPNMSPLYKRVEHEFGLDEFGVEEKEESAPVATKTEAPPPRPLPPPTTPRPVDAASNLTPLVPGESTPPVVATIAPEDEGEQWKAPPTPPKLPWSKPEPKRGRLPWSSGGNNRRKNQQYNEPLPGIPIKAAGASLLSLVPRLGGLLSGSPATVALIVITLGKAFSFYHTLEAVSSADGGNTDDGGKPARTSSYKPRTKKDAPAQSDTDSESEADAASGRPQDTPKATAAATTEGRGWLGALVNKSGAERIRLPRSRVLHEALEDMTARCAQAEEEKVSMEQAYEKTNWELQETKSELTSLKTTTRHLQSQITDNGEMLDKTIRVERRRAKEELLRMKQAMVKVVEEEREAMRSEFVKQAAELQTLWRQEQKEGDLHA